MKIFFIVIAFSLSLFGSDLLKIHRKLVPITLLQVKSIVKKNDKTIKILIIVNENELLKAQELEDLMPNKIKNFYMETNILKESKIDELLTLDFDAIYTFSLKNSTYEVINRYCLKNKIVTFSNSYTGLEKGILIFIDKKKKIKIYMNTKTMKSLKIPFNSKFLSIVKLK